MVRWCYGRRGSAVLRSFHGCPFAQLSPGGHVARNSRSCEYFYADPGDWKAFFGQGIEGYR